MTDDERLEESLRTTLHAKAAAIEHGPGWAPPHHATIVAHRWRAPALAAAAVIAAVVAISVVSTGMFRSPDNPVAATGLALSGSATGVPTTPDDSSSSSDLTTASGEAPSTSDATMTPGEASGTANLTTSNAVESEPASTPGTIVETAPPSGEPQSRATVCERWSRTAERTGLSELLVHHLAGKAVPARLVRRATIAYVPPTTNPHDPELVGRIDALNGQIARLSDTPSRDWSVADLDDLAGAWSRVQDLCGAYER